MLPQGGINEWQAEAAINAPALQQSALGIEMAKTTEKLTRSEMLPKVAIVAAENFDGPITFELPPVDKNLNIWYVGLGVRYSISSLFKVNKKLHQAQMATQQQELTIITQTQQVQAQLHSRRAMHRQVLLQTQYSQQWQWQQQA